MKPFLIKHKFNFCGRIKISGDKSIAHRALIISALANGKTIINNFPLHDDAQASLNVLKALGTKIQLRNNQVTIQGSEIGRAHV